jgi:hypothetical protein
MYVIIFHQNVTPVSHLVAKCNFIGSECTFSIKQCSHGQLTEDRSNGEKFKVNFGQNTSLTA